MNQFASVFLDWYYSMIPFFLTRWLFIGAFLAWGCLAAYQVKSATFEHLSHARNGLRKLFAALFGGILSIPIMVLSLLGTRVGFGMLEVFWELAGEVSSSERGSGLSRSPLMLLIGPGIGLLIFLLFAALPHMVGYWAVLKTFTNPEKTRQCDRVFTKFVELLKKDNDI